MIPREAGAGKATGTGEEALARELQRRPSLDLGCGLNKAPGFIGADRLPLRGVDVLLDLNHPFPFPDDSVERVLAQHSLEHVTDLPFTMKEIYRVCRHGALVCIVAPYDQQGLNLANPYHRQAFNEHTPRFWTNSRTALVDPSEYSHPHAEGWGLAESDNSKAEMDFRCLRMEFFYFPEYRRLSREEQREARKKHLDVCDQVMYQLLVVKKSTSEDEMKELACSVESYEPPSVTVRRFRDRCESLEKTVAELRDSLQSRTAETDRLGRELAKNQEDLKKSREESAHKGKIMAHELDLFRRRRAIRWVDRFSGHPDLRNDIRPAFQQLKDDSLIFGRKMNGYRLQPSVNLRGVPYLEYALRLNRSNLSGILLAPILDLPSPTGEMGIEIRSPSQRTVGQSTLPISRIDESAPARFDFPPIQDSDREGFRLRVFVDGVDTPVRLLEWRTYTAFGLGSLQTMAFCGFIFNDHP